MLNRSIALLLLLLPAFAGAGTFSGRVVQIIDGDTLVLETNRQRQRVDLAGIDAPERLQAFGPEAQGSLAQMAFNKAAQAECAHPGKQGRQTCTVRVQPADCPQCGMTLDLGHAQLTHGMAWWNRQAAVDPSDDAQGRYQSAEFMAQTQRRGLWSDKQPVRPWEWRKRWGLRGD